jgi:polyhydroxyalkanoate depolymerase
MTTPPLDKPPRIEHAVPYLWPLAAAFEMGSAGARLLEDNLRFVGEAIKIDHPPPPRWATPNRVLLDLDTMALRDFSAQSSAASQLPVLIDAPYAGHTANIADFADGQSLVQTLQRAGLDRVLVTDWKAATEAMKHFDIDKYLAEINAVVDDLGGRAHLVGLCQGGWMSAMFAARFPHKVQSLVLAGSPIDTSVGAGALHAMVRTLPLSYYEHLVALGRGRMPGAVMLAGWKNMHPDEQYLKKYIDLYAHIEDRDYLRRTQAFEQWYENPVDLPGRYYLQAIRDLFKDNLLAQGRFVALGRRIELRTVTAPTYLLAGDRDDITPAAQVFAARELLGTPQDRIVQRLAPGGHIGLFMGSQTLQNVWPDVARWIGAQSH